MRDRVMDRPRDWRVAGVITAVGALVLVTGLMLGPTPDEELAEALRDIDSFRTRYVATNLIDFVGAAIMFVGLLVLVRLQMRTIGGSLLALLGGVGVTVGGALFLLVLIVESAVHPEIAARFVEASGTEQQAHLAAGQAMLDLDAAVFGVSFTLMMAGIAAIAGAFLAGAGPRLNRVFLWVGVVLAALASPSAIAYLFEPTQAFGQLEPILGLAVLLWLVVLGTLLWTTERARRAVA